MEHRSGELRFNCGLLLEHVCMSKKSYFLLIDTETTTDDLVADFGAVIVDRKGKQYGQCAALVRGIYTDRAAHPLFHSAESSDSIWSMTRLNARYDAYERMVDSGSRMIATVNAINNWLAKASAQYQPILTAYNLAFDLQKCSNTGIDLTLFPRHFCLMHAAQTAYAKSKAYRRMVLKLHLFRNRTNYGNMTYRTDAETMARFCTGQDDLEAEPHTALEDCIFYEAPILQKLTKAKSNKWLLSEPCSHSWQEFQIRDNFKPS